VQQLDRLYPHLAAPEGQSPASLNATIGTPLGQLDAETVARASQAAIPLENARLYAALEQENLERKRAEDYLAEAQKLSCTGSFGWSVATDEHFWSDETYRIFEYEVSSKVSLQMVRERIHPEDNPGQKWVIDESILASLTGWFRSAIKKFVETHRSFININQANNTHGLGPGHNRGKARTNPDAIPELVKNFKRDALGW
jgi:hypothetical protein